jgi:hypothetical protein
MALTTQYLRFISGFEASEAQSGAIVNPEYPYKRISQAILQDTGTDTDSNYIDGIGAKAGTLASGASVTINLFDGTMTGSGGRHRARRDGH